MADELGKLALQPNELKEADRSAEFNEQIDVAVFSALVVSERTEERQTGNTEGVQHRATVAQDLQDVVASELHPDILARPGKSRARPAGDGNTMSLCRFLHRSCAS